MDYTYIVTIASVIGTVANVYKKQWCFIIWLFTNSFWCVFDFMHGLYGQALLFAVYVLLAVLGLVKWKKDGK